MSGWWLLLAGVLIGAGLLAALFVIAFRIAGPDTRDRAPDDDLAVARAAGVVPPDGSHDQLGVPVEEAQAEAAYLRAKFDASVDVVPGRETGGRR